MNNNLLSVSAKQYRYYFAINMIFFLLIATIAFAGGINIDVSSVRFNGNDFNTKLDVAKEITMSFKAEDYSYGSGNHRESSYIIFTLTPLDNSSRPYYFVAFDRAYKAKSGYSLYFEFKFIFPGPFGRYKLTYNPIKYFTTLPLNDGIDSRYRPIRLSENDIAKIKIKNNVSLPICVLNFLPERNLPEILELYIKVNNVWPYEYKMKGGLSKEPIVLSCMTRNNKNCENIFYKYKLEPESEEWSPWQSNLTFPPIYFIAKGSHRISVVCKYSLYGKEYESSEAYYSFNLAMPFFSQPASVSLDTTNEIVYIDKADIQKKTKNSADVVKNTYDRSEALLIGVPSNKPRTVENLPYVKQDIESMEKALKAVGFITTKLDKKIPTAENVNNAIRDLLARSNKNDRIIIYISSHGFIDDLTKTPYLICNDCNPKKASNCISILDIRSLLDNTKDKYKHVLLILDSCFSGLGIIDKNNPSGIKTIASKKGSHILTAGLGDQVAKMDNRLQRSVFTYYFTEGLINKRADYTKDGIITLTELLIYTQFNVANHTNSDQTPMMGRLNGIGEMIFN